MDYSIPFEYMGLNKAAKYFNCEVGDLVHWHKIGLIKLCIACEDCRAYLLKINDRYPGGYGLDHCYLESGMYDFRDENTTFSAKYIKENSNEVKMPYGVIDGYLVPDDGVIEYLSLNSMPLNHNFVATPYDSENHKFIITVEMTKKRFDYYNDSLTDVYTPKIDSQALLILNQDLITIRDLINPQVKSKVSQKTVNAMATFIKQLLAVNYGHEMAESPRKFIENKDSEIRLQFDRDGMSPPSGKAVSDWLKDVDI